MNTETLAIIGTIVAVGVGLAGWLMHLAGRITGSRIVRSTRESGSPASTANSPASTTRQRRGGDWLRTHGDESPMSADTPCRR